MSPAEERFLAISRQRNLTIAGFIILSLASIFSVVARVPYLPEVLHFLAIGALVLANINWQRTRRARLDFEKEKAAVTHN